jgi:hypothetical protein
MDRRSRQSMPRASVAVRLGWSGAQVAHALAVFAILSVGYLAVFLWMDYVKTIASAMILAQALYLPRKAVERRFLNQSARVDLRQGSADHPALQRAIAYAKRVAIDMWEMPLIFLTALLLLELLRQLWFVAMVLTACSITVWLIIRGTYLAVRRLRSAVEDKAHGVLTAVAAKVRGALPGGGARLAERPKAWVQRCHVLLATPPTEKSTDELGELSDGSRGLPPVCTAGAGVAPIPPTACPPVCLSPSLSASPCVNAPSRHSCPHLSCPPARQVRSPDEVRASRAATWLLTSTVLLVLLDSALLGVYAARDVVDVARDSADSIACAASPGP